MALKVSVEVTMPIKLMHELYGTRYCGVAWQARVLKLYGRDIIIFEDTPYDL